MRVHLRTYVAAGHDPPGLLEAFLRTANGHHGNPQWLEKYWQEAVALGVFPAHEMDEFHRELKAKSYPAVHHSAEYERLYRPAYRVISLAFCPEMML